MFESFVGISVRLVFSGIFKVQGIVSIISITTYQFTDRMGRSNYGCVLLDIGLLQINNNFVVMDWVSKT